MRDIDKYTEKYKESSFEDYQVKYRRKKIMEVINNYHPRSILEIGCGNKPLFSYISINDLEKYTIVEPSKFFFENAKYLSRGLENVNCINGLFEETSNNLNKDYDFILCSSLLHEVEMPEVLLHSIYNLCKENTVVHINVPNAFSLHRLLAKEAELISNIYEKSNMQIEYQIYNTFDLESLKEMVNRCGFCVQEEGSFFVKPFTHSQMMQCIEGSIIDDKVLDGLYIVEKYMSGLGSEIFVNIKIIL